VVVRFTTTRTVLSYRGRHSRDLVVVRIHICIEEYFSMFTALYRSKVIVFQYKYNVYDVLNVYIVLILW
jgi:hypothetical protein